MWQEIERLAGEENMTILLTTHYMEEADQLAARVAIIDRGRIVVEGTPAGLKRDRHGDSIQIELTAADGGTGAWAREALDRLPGLSEVQVDGATVLARAEDGGAAIPGVLGALDVHHVTVASVMVSRPSHGRARPPRGRPPRPAQRRRGRSGGGPQLLEKCPQIPPALPVALDAAHGGGHGSLSPALEDVRGAQAVSAAVDDPGILGGDETPASGVIGEGGEDRSGQRVDLRVGGEDAVLGAALLLQRAPVTGLARAGQRRERLPDHRR